VTYKARVARAVAALIIVAWLPGHLSAAERGPGRGPWQHASPEDHGFDAALLTSVGNSIGEIAGRQGLVIVHQGVIIYEDYWSNPYHQATPEWRNVSFSAAKSWASALVGVAITRGLFNLDTPVSSLHHPADSGLHPDTLVRHLLNMTSGGTLVIKPSSRRPTLKTENPAPGLGIEYVRVIKPDGGTPEGYGSGLQPGSTFYYDGEPVDHLANVITAASGMTAKAYSERFLLGPLGVEHFNYQSEAVDSAGNMRLAGSIELSTRDLARLGQLWLNGGRWNGEQLVDAAYVAESIQPSARNPGYGFLWWLNADQGRFPSGSKSLYFASGAFGQIVFVVPERDLVIATMGFQVDPPRNAPQLLWEALAPLLANPPPQ
jgi:CubicO group peptidase (beta-lactamase class C family)